MPNTLLLKNTVSLSPLALEHAPEMYRWMCDPDVSQNLGLRREPSLEKTIQWITQAKDDPSMRPFAILSSGQHVGNVILDRIDSYLASARLSVYIGEVPSRGSGVGRTGIYLALREAFESLALYKVWLTVHARNTPAIMTYQRLGFEVEGVLRDEFILRNVRIAALYMGVMANDFRRLEVVWM